MSLTMRDLVAPAALALALPVLVAAGPADAAAPAPKPLAGVVVGLDAGHNGRWSSLLDQSVDAGFGLRKPCNTMGTSTAAGYAEHAHNWDVAERVRARLTALGATVVRTRTSDTGVGPCIDVRSRTLARARTTLNVSIHADGALGARSRGFHVAYGTRTVGGARVAAASRVLATALRDRFQAGTGMPRSTYLGGGTALWGRSDLAFTSLATAPSVLLEAGNMRHPADAALLTSAAFRRREADAVVSGIRAYLRR